MQVNAKWKGSFEHQEKRQSYINTPYKYNSCATIQAKIVESSTKYLPKILHHMGTDPTGYDASGEIPGTMKKAMFVCMR